MRIDWAQTLLGDFTSRGQAAANRSGTDVRCVRAARVMRGTGVLISALFIGIAIAVLPARGSTVSANDILALSGLLLAQTCGLFLLAPERLHFRGAAFGAMLALPFTTLAGLDARVIVAVGLVLALDAAAMLTDRRPLRQLALAVGAGAAGAGLVWGELTLGASAVLFAALAPLAVAAFLPISVSTAQPHFDPWTRFNALLGVALTSRSRQLFVTDSVGLIDNDADPAFARLLTAQEFPDNSLTSAVLIADRVLLLDALSRAIHKREGTEGLEIRLRLEPAGAGFPAPPRFVAHRLAVQPLPESENRAIVLIEAIEEVSSREQAVPGNPDISPVLARALHDSTAPFNAGLGYLEMIADPRLSPRDVNTYRDFAAEAHKSVLEAYRNTVLLGRWVKLLHSHPGERVERASLMPRRMVNDAVRALNLREAEDRGELRILEAEVLPAVSLPPALARFAVEIFLREGQYGGPAKVTITREGDDLVLTSRQPVSEEAQDHDDVFRKVIEDAVSAAMPGIRFRTGVDGLRELRFETAFDAKAGEGTSAKAGAVAEIRRMAS
ncbi:MAG TPA: hypothetical protein PKW21_09630 [Rhabdaerophilum sp.]|nr:hypothetical protein [Rhabdaerophilum sp.]